MVNIDDINRLIVDAIIELSGDGSIKGLSDPEPKTRLYGAESGLDSLGLVTLISEIEERASDLLGIDILLADERAMSMTRSPFRSVEALGRYILVLAQEDGLGE